jgi:hypothetical protein
MSKQVTCVQCGSLVNKRQTLAVGTGRACRSHQETQEKSAEILKAEREKQQTLINKRKQRTESNKDALDLRCCVCNAVGLRSDIWYGRWLIESEKFEIINKRPPNIFGEDNAKIVRAIGKTCLNIFVYEGDVAKKIPLSIVLPQHHLLARNYKLLPLCPHCQQKYKVERAQPNSELTMEQLTNWAVIYQLAKASLVQIAKKELANGKNQGRSL